MSAFHRLSGAVSRLVRDRGPVQLVRWFSTTSVLRLGAAHRDEEHSPPMSGKVEGLVEVLVDDQVAHLATVGALSK